LFAGDDDVAIRQQLPPEDPAHAVRVYREWVVQRCRGVALRGKDLQISNTEEALTRRDLHRVYVDLDTTLTLRVPNPHVQAAGRRSTVYELKTFSALEVVVLGRHVVLLGELGCGKSSFLNHLAVCLAWHSLEPDRGWNQRLSGWPAEEYDLLPILVRIQDLARELPAGSARIGHEVLWRHMRKQLELDRVPPMEALLENALHNGRALLLFDGLDEVSDVELREKVCRLIDACGDHYSKARIVVTCRTGYSGHPLGPMPQQYRSFTLDRLRKDQVERFIDAWFADLARRGVFTNEAAEREARYLRRTVQQPCLEGLAANPLLLTCMALGHTQKGHLPEALAIFYEKATEMLLWRWEEIKQGDMLPSVGLRQRLQAVGRTDEEFRHLLRRLAFEVYVRPGDKARPPFLARPLEALRDFYPDRNQPERCTAWVDGMMQTMREGAILRGSIDTPWPRGLYILLSPTLQTYLAGAHLASQPHFVETAAELFSQSGRYGEIVLFAVGRLVHVLGDMQKPLALVKELLPKIECQDDATWRKVWLAGEVISKIGPQRANDTEHGRELLSMIRENLVQLPGQAALPSLLRAEAGLILGRLGDPRPGVGVVEVAGRGVPQVEWVTIEGGPFWMGSPDDEGYDNERPRFLCEFIREAYRVGKYLVTLGQYENFVESGGYRNRRWWTEAGWAWRESRRVKYPEELQFGYSVMMEANLPQVGVSWHEAVAYCRWMTEEIGAESLGLPQGWEVQLPSEAEWERMARGTEGRQYPWAGPLVQPADRQSNFNESKIGGPSAVGMFPKGGTPEGVMDAGGNVWEWTRSLWGSDLRTPQHKYPYDPKDGREDQDAGDGQSRVLRGGSWCWSSDGLRCAFRRRLPPGYRSGEVGFRVVALPKVA
jgi:formylglycine-generating enzyme required for sulfatase activity